MLARLFTVGRTVKYVVALLLVMTMGAVSASGFAAHNARTSYYYYTVQDAIDDAYSGDTIIIDDWTVYEALDIHGYGIVVKGGAGHYTHIYLGSNYIDMSDGNYCELQNVTIHSSGGPQAILKDGAGTCGVSDCTINGDNTSYGINVNNGAMYVHNCTLYGFGCDIWSFGTIGVYNSYFPGDPITIQLIGWRSPVTAHISDTSIYVDQAGIKTYYATDTVYYHNLSISGSPGFVGPASFIEY